MYNHTTIQPYKVLLLTCMVNCTAGTPTPRLCSVVQWSVHQAPSWTTQVLVLARARHRALEMYGGKNASSAFRLGQIYILDLSFISSVRKQHKFPGPAKEHGKAKPQRSLTFFDTQSKTSLTTITNPLFLQDDATKNMSNPLGSHARTTENTAYHHTKCYIQKLLTNTIRNSLGQKYPDFAHLWVMQLNVCFLNYTCKKNLLQ